MTDERISRCGPLSRCASNGHVDRLPGIPLKGHVWRDEEHEAYRHEIMAAAEREVYLYTYDDLLVDISRLTPQCAADGVRNGPDGPGGTEHYWTCTAPGTVDVGGGLLCAGHAEEYGYDPEDGNGG